MLEDGDAFDYIYDVPVEKITLNFDKPYLFIIRDKSTGEVWFVGTVYNPLSLKDEPEAKNQNKDEIFSYLYYTEGEPNYNSTSQFNHNYISSGDVTSDGMVNDFDKIYLEKYLDGKNGYNLTEQEKKRADVNQDGEIDKTDVDIIKKYVEGVYNSLPVKNATNSNSNNSSINDLQNNETSWKKAYIDKINDMYNKARKDYVDRDEYSSLDNLDRYFTVANVDIDKDGIPELIVHIGTFEAEKNGYFFTYKDGKLIDLGSISMSHKSLYEMYNQKYLVSLWMHMGEKEISKLYIENNKIKEQKTSDKLVGLNEEGADTEGDKVVVFETVEQYKANLDRR